MRSLLIGTTAAIALGASSASAATLSLVAFNGLISTGATTSQAINQFDPSLGTLLSIEISGSLGILNATQRFENEDSSAATLTATSTANTNLTIDGITNTFAFPSDLSFDNLLAQIVNSDDVTAYDGVTDFGGGSGRTFINQNDTDNFLLTYTAGDQIVDQDQPFFVSQDDAFTIFSGLGTVTFSSRVSGSGSVSGTNTITSQLITPRETSLRVEYTYETPEPPTTVIPAPAALPLLLSGLAVFGIARRMRKA